MWKRDSMLFETFSNIEYKGIILASKKFDTVSYALVLSINMRKFNMLPLHTVESTQEKQYVSKYE